MQTISQWSDVFKVLKKTQLLTQSSISSENIFFLVKNKGEMKTSSEKPSRENLLPKDLYHMEC